VVLIPSTGYTWSTTILYRIRNTAWTWLFCLLCISAQGQVAMSNAVSATARITGSIEGVVLDAENGDVLPSASFRVLNNAYHRGIADENGRFHLKDLPVGMYTLVISYLGYQDLTFENVTVESGKAVSLKLELKPLVLPIEEVVVTASMRSQAIKLAPASIGIITSKQLRDRMVTTFDQAFDEMPGVVVTRSGGANVQAFSIRGASEVAGGGIGNRVLLLIDGRPALSPESGGALWNLVPISSIDRIEVVRGAYSSLYGSSAMGGVVNVITRKPAATPQTRIHLNYGAYDHAPRSTGYQRYNDFYALDVSHSRQLGKFSYLLDGSLKSDDGHKEKTGFDLYNFYGKAAWIFNSKHQLQFSANANRMYSDAPATWLSKRQAYSAAAFKQDDYQDRREFNADLYYSAKLNNHFKYSSRLYHYRNASLFSFDGDPGNDSTNVNFGKQIVKSYSVYSRRLGNVSQMEWLAGENHFVIAGVDVKGDYVLGMPDTFLYGEHRALGAGVYVQDEISLSNRLTLTAGLRYDNYRIFGQVQESNVSPKVALLYQVRHNLSLRMLLAQAFRDPPIAERFIKFEQGGGLRFMPNPGLRPERLTLSAEIGAKMTPTAGGTLDVSFFYNRYNNLISFQQLSSPLEPLLYKVINLKESVMQGLELSYRQQWKEFLTLQLSYTFLDARDISPGRVNDALAYKVRHTLGASATTHYKGFTLNLNARYRSRIEEVFIYPGSEPDAVMVANTKVSYTFSHGFTGYFAVNNLNNAQYEELERYRMPGRSFTAGVEMRF
jgi:outer membrane receptor protein involved in Fe transport